ncbi:hypothetical protein OHA91_10350 [Streptomyces erythrochromogenes]|uniref:Uncharacterized protein n=1 Tax=Streptomyces erythrochromogenes TaxID=285574 RepID=A0ABZ1Q914_9ACTN|nr:hypothetical protein [Streptomyces erythrochromogenes]MCX5581976.1 hypothetical protein [Streptomyces erythrochromogenes]
MSTSPGSLVTAARGLVQPAPSTVHTLAPGLRARAAAVLLRMALDQALDAYWRRVTPSMTRIGKHRMLCLEWYAGQDTARRCRTTWSALSAACHYRTCELPPGPAEIRTRLLEVTGLLSALGVADGREGVADG